MAFIFDRIEAKDLKTRFDTEEKCLEFLAAQKWEHGFVCKKCGNTNYCKGKTPYSRRCTKCKSEESAQAHTLFHRCKLPLTEAFEMAYMICSSPDISTYELSRRKDIRQMTCWKLKNRIIECLKDQGRLT